MSQTTVSTDSPLAVKAFSAALFAITQRQPSLLKNLSGAAPTQSAAEAKLRSQTSNDFPVVRVTDLQRGAGDKVSVDLVNIIGGKPIVGDRNAEGTGTSLTFDSMDISLDLLSKVVDAGGKMTQQRTKWALDSLAMANGANYMSRLFYQKMLVHMAGARGSQQGSDWVVPAQTDSDFSSIMINPVKAPSYNRHYVVDGAGLVRGGAQLGSIDSTDLLKLSHLDELRKILDDAEVKLQPVKLPDDPAAADDPMWVFLATPLQYQSILADATANNNIRAFQAAAYQRASWGSKHPLFLGEVGMWNGILVKRMDRAIRFLPSEETNIVTSANRYTATETAQAVNASLSAGYAAERGLLLGAQALGHVFGRSSNGASSFNYEKNLYNFKRNTEILFEAMCGMAKIRFDIPNGSGQKEPTDHGIFAIDSAIKLVS